jgi:hypothetical protein
MSPFLSYLGWGEQDSVTLQDQVTVMPKVTVEEARIAVSGKYCLPSTQKKPGGKGAVPKEGFVARAVSNSLPWNSEEWVSG